MRQPLFLVKVPIIYYLQHIADPKCEYDSGGGDGRCGWSYKNPAETGRGICRIPQIILELTNRWQSKELLAHLRKLSLSGPKQTPVLVSLLSTWRVPGIGGFLKNNKWLAAAKFYWKSMRKPWDSHENCNRTSVDTDRINCGWTSDFWPPFRLYIEHVPNRQETAKAALPPV